MLVLEFLVDWLLHAMLTNLRILLRLETRHTLPSRTYTPCSLNSERISNGKTPGFILCFYIPIHDSRVISFLILPELGNQSTSGKSELAVLHGKKWNNGGVLCTVNIKKGIRYIIFST